MYLYTLLVYNISHFNNFLLQKISRLLWYNRPILVVANTNSTQGILRLEVTENVKCV